MKVVIIDYGLGNLNSVAGALRKLGFEPCISSKVEDIEKADKLILPGVGAFGDGIKNIYRLGLVETLNRAVLEKGKPILGICLGAQLMAKESYEFGLYQGLGWIDAVVVKIGQASDGLRVPHVGWNDLLQVKDNVLFDDIPNEALFYYVHSFCIKCKKQEVVIGECEYGARFTCVLNQDNIYATQFHPEKSQFYGLSLLKNFLTKT